MPHCSMASACSAYTVPSGCDPRNKRSRPWIKSAALERATTPTGPERNPAMQPAPPTERYDSVQIALHWLISALIVAAIGLIWTVDTLPKGDLRTTLFFLHRSCGVTILALAVLRLAWRLS